MEPDSIAPAAQLSQSTEPAPAAIDEVPPPVEGAAGPLPALPGFGAPVEPLAAQRLTRRSFLITATTTAVAFAGGLGVGFWEWGLKPVATATGAAPVPHAQAATPPALPASYTLPVAYGQLGPNLIRAGALDYDTFVQIHGQGGTPLSEAQRAILREGSDTQIVMDLANARFLLNLLWAVGLANNNPLLLRGALVANSQGQIEKYASTGGWTLATRPIHQYFSSSTLTLLTAPQQARLEEAAAAIYRPCCDNATSFPDCNHGMAMLGLLELAAAQDARVDDMLEMAKRVNRFWFPNQTQELALYHEAQSGATFDAIPAREAVGAEQFSSSGYAQVHDWLVAKGSLQTPSGGGNNCGV